MLPFAANFKRFSTFIPINVLLINRLFITLALVISTSSFSFADPNPCFVPPSVPVTQWSILTVFHGGSTETATYGEALAIVQADLAQYGPATLANKYDCPTSFSLPYCTVEVWVDRFGGGVALTETRFRQAICPAGYLQWTLYECRRDYSVPAPTTNTVKLTAGGEDDLEAGFLAKIEPGDTKQLDVSVTSCSGGASSGANVKLTVAPVNGSGGHVHHDEDRPKGLLSDGITTETEIIVFADTSGAAVTFHAPEVSGDYKITASCIGLTCNQQGDDKVWVGIEELQSLFSQSDDYELIGSIAGIHPGNHYLTFISTQIITTLAQMYRNEYPGSMLYLNDASLERGGLFDIRANWKPKHNRHRRGTVIDVRANLNAGAILSDRWIIFKELAAELGAQALLERFYNKDKEEVVDNRHFHVLLEGRQE